MAELTEQQPAAKQAKKKRRSKKKSKAKKQRGAKPLPAPIENQQEVNLPFLPSPQRSPESDPPSAPSSTSEPKPGQPLSEEAERILSSVPDRIDDAGADYPEPKPGIHFAESDTEAIAGLLPEIAFDPAEVGGVLEESFDWLAEKFDSAHWKLTERQSRMLAKPTAELLSSLYMKIGAFLPSILMGWCEATPGLMGFLLTSGIVIGPKVAVQFQLSRSRMRADKNHVRPTPTVIRPAAQPVRPDHASGVGMATSINSQRIGEDGFPEVV